MKKTRQKLSKRAQETKEEEIKSKKLKIEESVDEVKTEITNKIISNIGTLVAEVENSGNETDGTADKVK